MVQGRKRKGRIDEVVFGGVDGAAVGVGQLAQVGGWAG